MDMRLMRTAIELDRAAKRRVLALTSVGSMLVVLDAMVVATVLGTIRLDLDASGAQLQWTMNAFNLSFAVFLLTGAALGDRFGRRRMFVAGLGLFVAASVACASAQNISWLIAARAVQGAGGALVMPLAMALVGSVFPPHERGGALGLFAGVNGLALIIGPALGGLIAASAAWQWIFWLNLPLGLLLIPLVLRHVPESHGTAGAIDFGGIVLVTGAALALVWGLMQGNELGWLGSEIALSLAIGTVLTLAFVAWEQRTPSPMMPMRLFRSRAFAAANGAAFLFSAALYGVLFVLPQFFQFAQELDPLASGLRLLAWTATLFVVAPLAGRTLNRVGARALIAGGLALQAAGAAWIALIAEPGIGYAALVLPLIVCGAGVSMAMPAAQAAVLGAVAPSQIGTASGIYNMSRFMGAVGGIAVAGAVFARSGGYETPTMFTDGFVAAMAGTALVAALGALAGLVVPRTRGMA